MTFDDVSNFASATVIIAPSPSLTGTTLTVDNASSFPTPPFNATISPSNMISSAGNSEIVRVTNISSNVMTIVRSQEGTVAQLIGLNYSIMSGLTALTISNIESSITTTTTVNLMQNGNFINASTNGYGNIPDNTSNSGLASVTQGGFPAFSPALIQQWTGVPSSNCMGLWSLNGNFNDQSSNGYNLSPSASPPADTTIALMASAKSFTSASSMNASVTGSNLNIAGAQTLICYVRPTANNDLYIAGNADSGFTNSFVLYNKSNGVSLQVTGLTFGFSGNNTLYSLVTLTPNMWSMIIATIDGAGNASLWVNGIKTSDTYTGSHSAGTGAFAVGSAGAYVGNYFDGIIQGAAVYNVSFTDMQAKLLWLNTIYGGVKLSSTGSGGYLTGSVMMAFSSLLPGNITTLSAYLYQDTASIAQIGINDGSDNLSSTNSTINQWQYTSVTRTLSSTSVNPFLKFLVNSTGNVWIKRVMFNFGQNTLPFSYSADDHNRFPRLISLNPPYVYSGYQFEEKRIYSWSPILTGTGSMTVTLSASAKWNFNVDGTICYINGNGIYITGGTASYAIMITAPVAPQNGFKSAGNNVFQGTGTGQANNNLFCCETIQSSDDTTYQAGTTPYIQHRMDGLYNSGNFLLQTGWHRVNLTYMIL